MWIKSQKFLSGWCGSRTNSHKTFSFFADSCSSFDFWLLTFGLVSWYCQSAFAWGQQGTPPHKTKNQKSKWCLAFFQPPVVLMAPRTRANKARGIPPVDPNLLLFLSLLPKCADSVFPLPFLDFGHLVPICWSWSLYKPNAPRTPNTLPNLMEE